MGLRLAFILTAQVLKQNRTRTALTVLGVAIGVAAVIAIAALGRGAQVQLEGQIDSVGTNLIVVMAGNRNAGGVRQGQGVAGTLTPEDAGAIRDSIPAVQFLSPIVNARAQVVFANQNWSTVVQGTDVDWPAIRAWPLVAGAFFTREDVRLAAKVTVIGSVVRDQLFGAGANPTGLIVRVQGQPFTVAGVFASKGQTGVGRDQDDAIFVPYTTAQKKLLGITNIQAIQLSTLSAADTSETVEAVTALLRVRHKVQPGDPDDFTVRALDEIADIRREATRTMTLLLGCVAAISLVVGGIGVMNIMLVSVTERTQEIGLRMAVGARGRDILGQFLVEALLLATAGGICGVGVGYLVSRAATLFVGWPTSMSPDAVLLGLAVAVGTGVCFGLYPANKAASLDPIAAMRHE